uniref:K Homology domain-containing protein n=1 Tax=Tetraselmis sp. GSL018 TaxID=582737 RepID=A0A061S0Z5_9CHLO
MSEGLTANARARESFRDYRSSQQASDEDERAEICRKLGCPAGVVHVLTGLEGRTLRKLQRDFGVSITLAPFNPGQSTTVTVTGEASLVEVACAQLANYIQCPNELEAETRKHFAQEVHVFVDYSNIFISAQQGSAGISFINPQTLKDRVVNERTPLTLKVAGSVGTDAQAEHCRRNWERAGFQQHFVVRQAGQGERELSIDEKIVGEAYQELAKDFPRQQTLIILTGDGAENHGWGSFKSVVQRAMLKGWKVELWCWSNTVSPVYRTFAKTYPGNFNLYQLDIHRREIMIQRGGGRQSPHLASRRGRNNSFRGRVRGRHFGSLGVLTAGSR